MDDDLADKEFAKKIPPEVYYSKPQSITIADMHRSSSRTREITQHSPGCFAQKASSGSQPGPINTANGVKQAGC
jgi:D-tyrosyl-tRNA(Tyr) deacylase